MRSLNISRLIHLIQPLYSLAYPTMTIVHLRFGTSFVSFPPSSRPFLPVSYTNSYIPEPTSSSLHLDATDFTLRVIGTENYVSSPHSTKQPADHLVTVNQYSCDLHTLLRLVLLPPSSRPVC